MGIPPHYLPHLIATSVTPSALELMSNWPCAACTFSNAPPAAACSVCGSPRILEATDTCTQPQSRDIQPSMFTPSLGGGSRTNELSNDGNGGGRNTNSQQDPGSTLNSNKTSTNGGSSGGGNSFSSNLRPCATCKEPQSRNNFSKTQWSKREGSKCFKCTTSFQVSNQTSRNAEAKVLDVKRGSGAKEGTSAAAAAAGKDADDGIPTPLSMAVRPLRAVPGFDGELTCCRDWPQTKKGQPPNAQSAIFNPLLACALGPIEGHCTAAELSAATQWWTLALPAWPRWVAALQEVLFHPQGVAGAAISHPSTTTATMTSQALLLLAKAKGKPNPLVPRAKHRGSVPHFRGRDQTDVLESTPIAFEVYACITCLYSQAALDEADFGETTSGNSS